MNDTATRGRMYSVYTDHGYRARYEIKFGEYRVSTRSSYMKDVKYHLDNYPEVGALLLLLNIVYFNEGYLMLYDKS